MSSITLRGNPTEEEVAAVLALLSSRRAEEPDGYRVWRATRLKALRHKAFSEDGTA